MTLVRIQCLVYRDHGCHPAAAQTPVLCMVCTFHIRNADPSLLPLCLSGSSAPIALNELKMSPPCVKRSQAQTWLKCSY